MIEDFDDWDTPETCLHPAHDDRSFHCYDCGMETDKIKAERSKLAAAFGAAGFVLEHTGGGCEALVRYHGDMADVVTIESDAMIPHRFMQACSLARYTRESWCDHGGDPISWEDLRAREILARYI